MPIGEQSPGFCFCSHLHLMWGDSAAKETPFPGPSPQGQAGRGPAAQVPLPGSYAAHTVYLITTTLEQSDLMRRINVALLAPVLPRPSGCWRKGEWNCRGGLWRSWGTKLMAYLTILLNPNAMAHPQRTGNGHWPVMPWCVGTGYQTCFLVMR